MLIGSSLMEHRHQDPCSQLIRLWSGQTGNDFGENMDAVIMTSVNPVSPFLILQHQTSGKESGIVCLFIGGIRRTCGVIACMKNGLYNIMICTVVLVWWMYRKRQINWEKCMAHRNLYASCFFYNELILDSPHPTEYLRDKHCKSDFNVCARYRYTKLHGQDYVPKYLFPNDMFKNLNSDLPEKHKSPVEIAKVLNVLKVDGTFDSVSPDNLGELVKIGSIVAYQLSEGWVEVRRKINIGYRGQERRIRSLF